jgi:GNAT superfamily N-acetyltransferase
MNSGNPCTEAIGVSMIRETLDDLPLFDLPVPYTLRWYQPGDEVYWVEIHKAADPSHPYSLEKFVHEFEADRALLPLRQAYLCSGDGKPVGTTSAWFYQVEQKEFGLVHWVAIHPQHQGKGLANPLLSLICHRLRELGHTQAYLNTSTARIPAIGLYLKFGFVPHSRGDDAKALLAWSQVRQQLAHPAVDEFLNRTSLMRPHPDQP